MIEVNRSNDVTHVLGTLSICNSSDSTLHLLSTAVIVAMLVVQCTSFSFLDLPPKVVDEAWKEFEIDEVDVLETVGLQQWYIEGFKEKKIFCFLFREKNRINKIY